MSHPAPTGAELEGLASVVSTISALLGPVLWCGVASTAGKWHPAWPSCSELSSMGGNTHEWSQIRCSKSHCIFAVHKFYWNYSSDKSDVQIPICNDVVNNHFDIAFCCPRIFPHTSSLCPSSNFCRPQDVRTPLVSSPESILLIYQHLYDTVW